MSRHNRTPRISVNAIEPASKVSTVVAGMALACTAAQIRNYIRDGKLDAEQLAGTGLWMVTGKSLRELAASLPRLAKPDHNAESRGAA